MNVFDFRYVNLFLPDDGVEFIHSIIESLGYGIRDYKSSEVREETLEAISQLLELKMLEVYRWEANQEEPNDRKLSDKEILNKVEQQWFIGADYVDFLGMVMFGHPSWYVDKLNELGFTPTTDWKWFVKHKIGDLEKWIKDNKP